MDIEHFRRRLLEEEERLLASTRRAEQEARDVGADSVRDAGDESVADQTRETAFKEADTYATLLKDVREALQRLEAGAFGRCRVCGEGIEEKRLEAAPWTHYCRQHQEELEEENPVRTPTL